MRVPVPKSNEDKRVGANELVIGISTIRPRRGVESQNQSCFSENY